MGMTDSRHIEQTWGSHIPLLTAYMKARRPQRVMECGCGDYSTPILRAAPYLHSVEHDTWWGHRVSRKYPGHKWTVHPLKLSPGFIKNSTLFKELTPQDRQVIRCFYYQLALQEPPLDLLFVDSFTVCRVPAVLELGRLAHSIIIHDIDSTEHFEWSCLNDFLKGYHKYQLRPQLNVDNKYPVPWTGLFCKTPLGTVFQDMDNLVRESAKALWGIPFELEIGNNGG